MAATRSRRDWRVPRDMRSKWLGKHPPDLARDCHAHAPRRDRAWYRAPKAVHTPCAREPHAVSRLPRSRRPDPGDGEIHLFIVNPGIKRHPEHSPPRKPNPIDMSEEKKDARETTG